MGISLFLSCLKIAKIAFFFFFLFSMKLLYIKELLHLKKKNQFSKDKLFSEFQVILVDKSLSWIAQTLRSWNISEPFQFKK